MEIINANAALLCNFEVMTHLKELPSQQKKSSTKSQLATITYETMKYLEASPCTQQSPEVIQNYLQAMKSFDLTKGETLMLLNNPPSTALEIQLMVEESEERFTDEQVEKLLKVIENILALQSQVKLEESCIGRT